MSKFSTWLFSPVVLAAAIVLLLVVLLRVPSFAEPYWYGDEGIYLTIGQAMNNGDILYKDIVDHKTPIIYYLARVGTQLNFRLLLTVWMAVASLAVFGILLKVTKRTWLSCASTTVFVIVTSIPTLEGNIPNGELFVMGFALVGLLLYLHTRTGLKTLSATTASLVSVPAPTRREYLWWLAAGVCMGAAILTKVPALFDAAALFFIGWLAGWDVLLSNKLAGKKHYWMSIAKQWGVLLTGVVSPILLSIVYFVSIGAGKEYLEFGLLYNFHYVQTWVLGYLPSWGQSALSLPGKAGVLFLLLIALTLSARFVSRPVRFFAGWFALALFASILSNRPYPHYILQVIPPLTLLIGVIIHQLSGKRRRVGALITLAVSIFLLYMVWTSLRISHYPLVSYYKTYFNLVTNRITPIEYRNSFNYYLADNYAASLLLRSTPERHIFVWGTDPMLYALSGKQPVGRFTVSFHIHDLKLHKETMDALNANKPKFIVVMHDEQGELPGFSAFLRRNYLQSRTFEHFTVWRRRFLVDALPEAPEQ